MEHLPHHVNPPDGRMATAPYNFVPLPQQVLLAEKVVTGEPWKAHDRWLPGTHSGWIDLQIEALTPLFIRGPVRRDGDGTWGNPDARLRREPWTTRDGRPVIPGSSLRGMLRTLVEILAFAKITPVSADQLFFRSMAADAIAKAYRDRVSLRNRKPEAGFLRKDGGGWVVEPCEMLRVKHYLLRQLGLDYPAQPKPDYYPPWDDPKLQQQRCWVQRHDDGRQASKIELGEARPDGKEWLKGTLVLTGSAPGKKAEFVFLAGPASEQLTVPDDVWRLFHDDDQLTKWQKDAFPVGKPEGTKRDAPGFLRVGEPVFFLREGRDQVRFLGRAQMFRFPYDRTVADLVPPEPKPNALDVAEALFGRVAHGKSAVKGRMCVEDAVAIEDHDDWFEPDLGPLALESPRPTTVPHYLTQSKAGSCNARALTTYVDGDTTTIRGHKLYWHRWDKDRLDAIHTEPDVDLEESDRHTVIRPVRDKVVFMGRIRFDNLTDRELGALLAVLRLPEECAHKLGMGKPLGLGSVRITPTLHLIDRARRYLSWSDEGELDEGAVETVEKQSQDAFEAAVVAHAQRNGEPMVPGREGLGRVARLEALYLLLRWDDPLPRDATEYLELDEFEDRRVLPTPHRLAKLPEPVWPGPAPKSATYEQPTQRREGASPTRTAAPRTEPVAPRIGSRFCCRVLTKREKGGWVFELPDGQKGILDSESPTPPKLAAGVEVDLVLVVDAPRSARVKLWWVDPDNPQLPPTSVKKERDGRRRKPKRGRH
ncbi:MAG: TIGR03986 family type III CRISPR-associated RAMP protein [Egibacteraceae bacterium]